MKIHERKMIPKTRSLRRKRRTNLRGIYLNRKAIGRLKKLKARMGAIVG